MNNVTLSLDSLADIPDMDDSDLTAEERAELQMADNMTAQEHPCEVTMQQLASVSDAGGANIPQMDGRIEKVLNFNAYGNPNANTKLKVKYNVANKTIQWGRETYKFNERLVRVQKQYGFEVDPYLFATVDTKNTAELETANR